MIGASIGAVMGAYTLLIVLTPGEAPAIMYRPSEVMEVCQVTLPSPEVACVSQTSLPIRRDDGWSVVDAIQSNKGGPK